MSEAQASGADQPLWRPSDKQIKTCELTQFMRQMAEAHGAPIESYHAFQQWSASELEAFWSGVWDYCGVIGEKGDRILIDRDKMPGAQYFPDARLNFAENLLSRTGSEPALIFNNEGEVRDTIAWDGLHEEVRRLAAAFADWGIGQGDRVAAYMPNCPETVIAMLAASSLGATFSSCSPDFGVNGVLDRFGQIEPKVLIACDGVRYNGKVMAQHDKLKEVIAALPTLKTVVVVPFIGQGKEGLTGAQDWPDVLAAASDRPLSFARVPFSHPLYIMFSSGTTGKPKCIVHSVGGTLLQQMKEHKLNCDLKPGERLFYFTTCGWMMWNWLVGGLSCGATLCLYDGSPFAPSPDVLFDYIEKMQIDVFGISAKFVDAINKEGLSPKASHDLSSVRMMLSTGSPLVPEAFDYVYEEISSDLQLCSISGGTDILSCFVLGSPLLPVYRGEIQAKGLGMAVEIWDDDGTPLGPGEGKGELVCTRPFPSMPIGFWNDPDAARYKAAYFERFPGIWCHGDFAEETIHRGIVIHGRSDATLNPGGVRIGTAEIYAQVERLEEVKEAIAVGQDWAGDVRVVLFVVLQPGETLTDDLVKKLKTEIRQGASPRHVPAKIIQVTDIPRTKSGKITEIAVRDVIHGREVKNQEALENPQALDLYTDLAELQTD